MSKDLREYEILIEGFIGITSDGQMHRKLIEAELSDLLTYVIENDKWPIVDTMTLSNGDFIVITQSGDGNIRKYTFMPI